MWVTVFHLKYDESKAKELGPAGVCTSQAHWHFKLQTCRLQHSESCTVTTATVSRCIRLPLRLMISALAARCQHHCSDCTYPHGTYRAIVHSTPLFGPMVWSTSRWRSRNSGSQAFLEFPAPYCQVRWRTRRLRSLHGRLVPAARPVLSVDCCALAGLVPLSWCAHFP